MESTTKRKLQAVLVGLVLFAIISTFATVPHTNTAQNAFADETMVIKEVGTKIPHHKAEATPRNWAPLVEEHEERPSSGRTDSHYSNSQSNSSTNESSNDSSEDKPNDDTPSDQEEVVTPEEPENPTPAPDVPVITPEPVVPSDVEVTTVVE